jgi:hypothetical protein
MTTDDHTERERATGRRPLRAHARGALDRALLVPATRQDAEAERRTAKPQAAGHEAPPAGQDHCANSTTKEDFCTRDRRRLRLVGVAVAAGLVQFIEAAR